MGAAIVGSAGVEVHGAADVPLVDVGIVVHGFGERVGGNSYTQVALRVPKIPMPPPRCEDKLQINCN